jgi:hypothetical protein
LRKAVLLIIGLLTLLPPVWAGRPGQSPQACVRFAFIGDYGEAGQPEADVAALVAGWSPDLIITSGDNNYPVGAAGTIDANVGQYYHSFIFPYLGGYGSGSDVNRFFPTLGNHDWDTAAADAYLDYFTLSNNERYYDFVWGPVHFFMIDSDIREPDDAGADSAQAQWFQPRMQSSTAPWQIAVTHHPPYSSDNGAGSIRRMQWPYLAWGVDTVLAGHSHLYERLSVDGLTYIVNGLGGRQEIHQFGDPLPGSQARFNGDYGAMNVYACDESIQFDFFTRTGALIDSYILGSPPPTPTPTATATPGVTPTPSPTVVPTVGPPPTPPIFMPYVPRWP